MTAALSPVLVSGGSPGPGQRVSRTAGQGGGALVLIELWQAFGWFGAASWTADESAQRWPALTAALLLTISIAHNGYERWSQRRTIPVEAAIDLDALPEPDDIPPAGAPKRRTERA